MPMARNRRRRKTCHHKAGHALARWFFGFGTDRAVVLTVDEVRAGKRIRTAGGNLVRCEGMVLGSDILPWPHGPRVSGGGADDQAADDRWRAYRRDVELIDCYAGFHAEARYGHIGATAAVLAGGDRNMARFRAVVDAWFPGGEADGDGAERAALERRVVDWTRVLVGSPMGQAAIGSIAEALRIRGSLSDDRIARLCRSAYGDRECRFEGWAPHWPPTPRQLRRGFIPGPGDAPSRGTDRHDPLGRAAGRPERTYPAVARRPMEVNVP